MSIQNYGELKTAVANWLKCETISDRIPEFIELAENSIFHELDITDVETEATLTIDQREIALPSGFLEQRRHYIDVTEPVQRITYAQPEWLWLYDGGWKNSSAFPRYYTIEAGNLVFSPQPDSDYTGKWLYLARLDRLTDDADTNIILQQHTSLYLYGALIHAEGFLADDPRMLTWASMYENAMELARTLGRRKRFPKGQKTQRTTVPVSSGGRTKM